MMKFLFLVSDGAGMLSETCPIFFRQAGAMGERRMYSAVQRLNSLSTISITILAFFAAVLAASTLYFERYVDTEPTVEVRLNTVHKLGRHGAARYHGHEEAHLSLDLEADLRPLLHWNVKQLFVYVLARWQTPTHPMNEGVVWDFIVQSADQGARFRFEGLPGKYPLVDNGRALRGANVTLEFHWNVMPYSGVLLVGHRAFPPVTLPDKYVDAVPHVY